MKINENEVYTIARKHTKHNNFNALIHEEILREICGVAHCISGYSKHEDESEYDEFAWKNHVDYDYLVRTGQHLDV